MSHNNNNRNLLKIIIIHKSQLAGYKYATNTNKEWHWSCDKPWQDI